MLQLGQIHFTIWTNTFYNLDKCILQFGQIHFTIWTNTIYTASLDEMKCDNCEGRNPGDRAEARSRVAKLSIAKASRLPILHPGLKMQSEHVELFLGIKYMFCINPNKVLNILNIVCE